MDKVILIGYSGHAYVAYDCLRLSGWNVIGYCESNEKEYNPFKLPYLGLEIEYDFKNNESFFVGIGDNTIRAKITESLPVEPIIAVHPNASISEYAKVGKGTMVCSNASINAFALVGDGVIINTGAIVEHECTIKDYAHVAPGAVLAGNVNVGQRAFIGANAVVKQGINIGEDAIIGAGAVVLRDVPARAIVIGNPGRIVKK